MEVKIFLPDCSESIPLYYRARSESHPYAASLEIDVDARTALWGCDPHTGGEARGGVRHYTVTVGCDPALSGQQILTLTEELRPLIERVCAGGTRDWPGSYVERLDEDAEEALEAIELVLAGTTADMNVWDAEEWIAESTYTRRDAAGHCVKEVSAEIVISATTTDRELRAAVSALQRMAEWQQIALWRPFEALEALREKCVVDARGPHPTIGRYARS